MPSVAAQRRDPALLDVPFNYNARSRTKGLRIGYDATEFGAKGQAKDRHVRTMLAEAGFEMVPVKLPAIPLRPLYLALLVEAAASFDELTRSGADDQLRRQTDDAWPNSLRTIRYLPAVEYMQARRLRRRAVERDALRQVGAIDPEEHRQHGDPRLRGRLDRAAAEPAQLVGERALALREDQ